MQNGGTGGADLAKRIQGAKNRDAGALFEQMLEAGCAHYAAQGVAMTQKTPEPVKPLSGMDSAGRFTAVFVGKAQGDFTGTLAGGRSVAFEAKCTERDRIEQRAVTGPQTEWMEAHYKMGALCFVVVGLLKGGKTEAFRVPWQIWRNMKGCYGRKYMGAKELWPFAVPTKMCGGEVGVMFLEDSKAE